MSPELDQAAVRKAAAILERGGVVAFPTETSYGLGASIRFTEAMDRIFTMKNRPAAKPLLVIIPSLRELDLLAGSVPEKASLLMKRFWPGPLTILFPARTGLSWHLCGTTGRVGVRISSNPWAAAMVAALGEPVTATSANLSGLPPACEPGDVTRQLSPNPPDWILDGGRTPGGRPSTIVDVTSDPLKIVREGAIPADIILKAAGSEAKS